MTFFEKKRFDSAMRDCIGVRFQTRFAECLDLRVTIGADSGGYYVYNENFNPTFENFTMDHTTHRMGPNLWEWHFGAASCISHDNF